MLAWGHTQGLSNQHLCDLKHLAHLLRGLNKMFCPSAVGGSSESKVSIFPLCFLSKPLVSAAQAQGTAPACRCSLDKLERVSSAFWGAAGESPVLTFAFQSAGGIRVQHQGFRTASFFQSASFTFRCLEGGIYGSSFPKSWLKGWDQPPGGSAKGTCNPIWQAGIPFSCFYHLILWRAVQLALVAPRGNVTISLNSLSIIWYCSICPQVICVMSLNLHLSWGSWGHFLGCIAAITWPAIAICVL